MTTIPETVYVGQTALQIQLNTKIDLTYGNIFAIKYKDPNGVTGSWLAAVLGDPTSGIIMTDEELTMSNGLWTVWAYVTFDDATTAPGKPATFYCNLEGE